MSSPSPENAPSQSFRSEASRSIAALRRAFAAVLEELPGTSLSSPTALGRQLKIDTKLAWKITNFLGESEPFQAALFAPRKTATALFLKAAKREGVSRAALDSVSEAMDGFDEMVKRHGGDRRSIEMMFAGHLADKPTRIFEEHRRMRETQEEPDTLENAS